VPAGRPNGPGGRDGHARQSHLNVRAADVSEPAAQTARITASDAAGQAPSASTVRRPPESAEIGSSPSTGSIASGNRASGTTTPPQPSSRR